MVRVRASANATDTNFGAILVDYGPATQVSRTRRRRTDARRRRTAGARRATADEACYLQVEKRLTNVTQWRVSKGILDALNRNSYAVAEPLIPGEEESFTFPLLPQDYVFPAGHRIGLVLVGSYSGYGSQADQNRATISLNVTETLFDLPVVGGKASLVRAGLEKVTPADLIETPPAELESEVSARDLRDG